MKPDSALGAMPNTTHTASVDETASSPVFALFDRAASLVTRSSGSPAAFCAASLLVFIWIVSGPAFHFSENWQLVINTGTTIVTFLMVFLIQHSQNKDSAAVHLKLDELLAANLDASNRMIGIEDLDEEALRKMADYYVRLADRVKQGDHQKARHSIDEDGSPAG